MMCAKIFLIFFFAFSHSLYSKAILFLPDTAASSRDLLGSKGIFFKTLKQSNRKTSVVASLSLSQGDDLFTFVSSYTDKHKTVMLVVCGALAHMIQDLLYRFPEIKRVYTLKVSEYLAQKQIDCSIPLINFWTRGDAKSVVGACKLRGNNVRNCEILAEYERGSSLYLFAYEYYLRQHFPVLPKYIPYAWFNEVACYLGKILFL